MRSLLSGRLAGVLRVTWLMAVTGGCTVIQKDFAAPLAGDPRSFVPGQASLEEVVQVLGPPTSMSALPEGSVILYESADILELQIALGLVDYLKLALGRGTAKREEVVFTFDGDGRLLSSAIDTRDENLGTGGSLQIAIAVQSVVNTEEVEKALAPHQWGVALLRPVGEGLNRACDLASGMSGVEQAGSSLAVGQSTLEWSRR